jgi:hypothetical protein
VLEACIEKIWLKTSYVKFFYCQNKFLKKWMWNNANIFTNSDFFGQSSSEIITTLSSSNNKTLAPFLNPSKLSSVNFQKSPVVFSFLFATSIEFEISSSANLGSRSLLLYILLSG